MFKVRLRVVIGVFLVGGITASVFSYPKNENGDPTYYLTQRYLGGIKIKLPYDFSIGAGRVSCARHPPPGL